jgi:hypothetical protein
MGFIRGGLLVIVSVVLFFSLLASGIFLSISMSLDYEEIKTELVPVIKEMANEEADLNSVVEETYPEMTEHCLNNSDYVFTHEDYVFELPCETVSQGTESIIDYGINDFVEKNYNAEYDCELWDCLGEEETLFVLVSQKAKDYWKGKFWIASLISLVLIALVFFLVETKSNFFIVSGGLIALSSVVLKFSSSLIVKFVILPALFAMSSGISSMDFSFLIEKSHTVFLIYIVLGIFLIALGIGFKFLNFSRFLSEKFNLKMFSNSSSGEKVEKNVSRKVVEKK